jgi:hypothetical protein
VHAPSPSGDPGAFAGATVAQRAGSPRRNSSRLAPQDAAEAAAGAPEQAAPEPGPDGAWGGGLPVHGAALPAAVAGVDSPDSASAFGYRAPVPGSAGQFAGLLPDGGVAPPAASAALPPQPPDARGSLLKELSRRRLGLLQWGDAAAPGVGSGGGGGGSVGAGPGAGGAAALAGLASSGSATPPPSAGGRGWGGSPGAHDDDSGAWPVSVEVRAPSPVGAFGGGGSDPGAPPARPHRASTGSGAPRRLSGGALGRGVRALLRFGSFSANRPGGATAAAAAAAAAADGATAAYGNVHGRKGASDGGGAAADAPGGFGSLFGGAGGGPGWDPALGPFASPGGRALQSLQSIHPGGGSKALLYFPSAGPPCPADSLLAAPNSSLGLGGPPGSGAPGEPGGAAPGGSGGSGLPAGRHGKRPPAARSDDLLQLAMESQQAQAVRIVVDALVAGRFRCVRVCGGAGCGGGHVPEQGHMSQATRRLPRPPQTCARVLQPHAHPARASLPPAAPP